MHHAPGSDSPATHKTSAAEPHLELTRDVEGGSAQMREVRAELRSELHSWQLGERVANAVLDVAHELVVNAHQHGTPPVRLRVTVGIAEVRVEVYDASSVPARLLPYRPGVSEHGLGLQLVRQLSITWGQTLQDAERSEPAGKFVWAIFPRPTGTSG